MMEVTIASESTATALAISCGTRSRRTRRSASSLAARIDRPERARPRAEASKAMLARSATNSAAERGTSSSTSTRTTISSARPDRP